MEYQVMVFMAKDRLSAVDVDEDGKTDEISIDGNDMMRYTSQEHIEKFSQYLKNYYNIDSFSDLEMAFFVIKFDAAMGNVYALLEELRDVAECNLVSVEKMLPWMAFKEGLLKTNTAVQVKAFDIVYTVSMDRDLAMKCRIGGTGEQTFILSEAQFAQYNCLSKDSLFGCGDEIEKLRNQLKELERQLLEEKRKAEAAEDSIQKIVSKIYEIRDEKKCGANRSICRIKCKNREKDSKFEGDSSEVWPYVFKIQYCLDDTEIVKKGQKIANVFVYRKSVNNNEKTKVTGGLGGFSGAILEAIMSAENGRWSDMDFVINAACDGRVFWLQELVEELTYGSDIAIIGDISDTKEDAMKWYGKNK